MSEFLNAIDSPYSVKIGDKMYTFPKLTLRNIGKLASVVKAIRVKQLREVITEEQLTPEQKARFLALTASRDFTTWDVWDWSESIDGGLEVAKTSLMQSGISEDEAIKVVDSLTSAQLLEVAMESCDHMNSPSRVAQRQLEAKNAEKKEDTDTKK
jgi:hypothetical protein